MTEILNRWITEVDWHARFYYLGDISARLLIAVFVSLLLGKIAGSIVRRIARKSAEKGLLPFSAKLDMMEVVGRFTILFPFIILYIISGIMFIDSASFLQGLNRFLLSILIILGIHTLNGFLDALDHYYQALEVAKKNPIKGYLQLLKIFLGAAGIIIVAAVLLKRSPWVMLSGLGAMTALVVLIFKDWILGLIASIQINANHLVVIGDSIEIERYGVNGEVIEIALSTVKVKNWDNTISMIPAYSLISETFKNWHGVKESGGRRIKRLIFIDMTSIELPDARILKRIETLELLKKTDELKELRKSVKCNTGTRINGEGITNIGIFRRYVELYLSNYRGINNERTLMAKLLEPTAHGIPLQIYAFTTIVDVVEYESAIAGITEHIIAALPLFGLRLFQNPSGTDIRDL